MHTWILAKFNTHSQSFKALGKTLLKVTLYNGGRSKNGEKKGKGLAPFAILSRSESEGEEKVISIEKHDPGVTFKNSGTETRDRSTLLYTALFASRFSVSMVKTPSVRRTRNYEGGLVVYEHESHKLLRLFKKLERHVGNSLRRVLKNFLLFFDDCQE